jgi:hypothetical protein
MAMQARKAAQTLEKVRLSPKIAPQFFQRRPFKPIKKPAQASFFTPSACAESRGLQFRDFEPKAVYFW